MARTTRWLSGSATGNCLESARVVRTVGTVVSGLQIQDAISPLDEDLVRVFKPWRRRVSARSQVVGFSGHNFADGEALMVRMGSTALGISEAR